MATLAEMRFVAEKCRLELPQWGAGLEALTSTSFQLFAYSEKRAGVLVSVVETAPQVYSLTPYNDVAQPGLNLAALLAAANAVSAAEYALLYP